MRLTAFCPATCYHCFSRFSVSFASLCGFRLPSTVLQHRPVLFATLFSLCFTQPRNPFPCRFPCLTLQRLPHRETVFISRVFTKKNSNMEEKKQLIPTAEAAKFLGLKVSYLHKLMMRRVIPYYKPNGKLCFFDKAELEAWQKNIRIASQAELDQQAQAYIVGRGKGGK